MFNVDSNSSILLVSVNRVLLLCHTWRLELLVFLVSRLCTTMTTTTTTSGSFCWGEIQVQVWGWNWQVGRVRSVAGRSGFG